MTRNLRHDLKRVAAGVCALMLVSGTVPVKPIAEVINEYTAITAYADETETLLTTITGAGSNAATATSANVSYSTEGVATLTFSGAVHHYSSSPAWGWWGYGWTATVTPAEGYTITKCVFYDDTNHSVTDSLSPFVVETTEEDKKPQVNDSFIYDSIDSHGITKIEVYGYATPAVDTTTVYTAPTAVQNLEYNGQAQALVTEGTASDGATMKYAVVPEGKKLATKIVEGDQTVSPVAGAVYRPTGLEGIWFDYYHIKYDNVEYSDGSGNGNIYIGDDGKTKILGTRGNIKSLPDDCNAIYVKSISGNVMTVEAVNTANCVQAAYGDTATATNAGDYTVYYKAVRESDGSESEVGSVTATIAKADATVTAANNLTYDGTEKELVTATAGAEVKYATFNYTVTQGDDLWLNVDNIKEGNIYKPTGNQGVFFPANYSMEINNTKYSPVINTNRICLCRSEIDDDVYKNKILHGTTQSYFPETTHSLDSLLITGIDTKNKVLTAEFVKASNYENGAYNWSTDIPTKTNAGTYTVYYKVEGNNNYNSTDVKSVGVTIARADPTVAAPTAKADLIYTGEDQALIEGGSTTGGTMQYSLDGVEFSTEIPEATNAGKYTVYYKVIGNDNYNSTDVKTVDVTIARADPTVTAPTAKIDLIYTGKDQALIEGGSTTGGTMQYSLDGVEFSTEIPEATNAGGYTVYYKVIGDDNYNSTDVKFVDVTIARADLPVTVTGYEGTFDGDPHGISVDVGNSDAVVYYAKSAINADNYAEIGSTVNPSYTNAGSYRVYYYVTTGNYDPNPVSGSKLVTIKKADAPALTDDQKPTPVDKLVYTGEALDLVTAPENIPDGYSIRYSINGGAWISTLPTTVESGTYTVAYKYVENTNYKDIAGETFTITVKDKYSEPMWVWADDYSSATATFIKNDNSSEPIILDAEVTSEVVSEPTYTEYGKTVYIATVKLEGKTYTYRKPVITAKLALTHVEAVPATCDEAGNIEYWFDAENEKYFADAKGENEITMADTIVAPIDHAYGAPQWIWNAENAATATFKCDNCGDEQVVNAVVTAEVTAPTYTKNGKTVYTATVNFEGETYTDTLTVTIGKKAYTAPAISYLKGDGAVKLSWNAIEGAERYAIAGFIDGKWKLLNRTEDTSFIIDNLNPGEQYKVAVVAMFDGEYIMDFSNAITVTPKPAAASVYPKITEIEYNEQYHQFKLNWTEVPNAQNYGIAVYLAGKWKIQTQSIPATTTSFTSPKLKAGQTYKMIVCAKVNGKWDLSALNSRAFTVTVK